MINKIPALTTLLLQGAPTVMWLFYTVVTKTLTEPDFSSFDLPVLGYWGMREDDLSGVCHTHGRKKESRRASFLSLTTFTLSRSKIVNMPKVRRACDLCRIVGGGTVTIG